MNTLSGDAWLRVRLRNLIAHTVGHTSHVYTIGHSHILSKDTYSTGAADEWVFGRVSYEK